MQDEEYGELKKKRREERAVIRKKEQRFYEEESVSFEFPCSQGMMKMMICWAFGLLLGLCRAGADGWMSQMRTRHSNMIAMAHFLKTRTEPVLVCFPTLRFCGVGA